MKKSIFARLTQDHGSILLHKIDNFTMFSFKLYSNFFAKVISFIRNVKIGKGCQFIGLPHFRRYPFSTIQIGQSCVFRSDHTSNLIGVNHQCILSTHLEQSIIKIGDNCGFSGVSIGAAKEVRIGNNVLCGANSVITDFDWHLNISSTCPAPVIIHDNVWIGLNTVILKGVEIGENSIIGANSLVTSKIPPNVIAGGVPCRVIKAIIR